MAKSEVFTEDEKSVLEAFNRFDADGSGSISREELGQVLKALDPESWDKDSIDQVLADADASGDGSLQIKEFIRWAFAQNESISGGRGFLTLKIEGATVRPELNGIYMPERETYFQRPVFYCAENDRVLFYHGKRKQWQIYWQTSTLSSARLKTSRSPHICGEAETWATYDSKQKKFVPEPEMRCRLLTPEEQQTAAPPWLMKFDEPARRCPFDPKQGLGHKGETEQIFFYKKTEEMYNDRPVYDGWRYGRADGWHMFYDSELKIWKLATDLGKPGLPPSRSVPTNAWSPHLTPWYSDERNIQRVVIPHEIDAEVAEKDGKLFTMGGVKCRYPPVEGEIPEGWIDPDFPHEVSTIYIRRFAACFRNYETIKWMRIPEITATPVLFDDLSPADVCQEGVSDCWLITALACLAEFPSFFKDHIFVTQEIPSETGKIELKLFDCKEQVFKVHQIDDYFAMHISKYGAKSCRHIFCPITDHKVLFALVEKAFAKMCGCYANLKSGYCFTAWAHLTGCCECERFRCLREKPVVWEVAAEKGIVVRSKANRASPRLGRLKAGASFEEVERSFSWIKFKKLEGDGPDEGYLFYYENGQRVAKRTTPLQIQKTEYQIVDNPRDDEVEHDDAFKTISTTDLDVEEYWKTLLSYDQANYLMATQTTALNDEMPSGLVPGHAYSVLTALEVEGVRLVRCRNPWAHTEWNGPWSDRCDEWSANPTIAEALNVDLQYEGSFWMDFEDWVYIMGEMRVTKKSMPTKRGALDIPIVED